MSHLIPEDIEAIGRHVAASPGGISLGALARLLGVSVSTARRRLQAYATAHGLTLQSERAREGARGPVSQRWFFQAASAQTPEVLGLDDSRDAALGLAPAIISALEGDERQALRLLAATGAARTSELAARVGRSPDRMEGLMRTLRRKLHRLGSPLIDDETLADGEALFRYLPARGA